MHALKTALIVDDSQTVRIQIQRILRAAGYKVAAVENGRKAINFLSEFCPSVLILDVVMPELDGYGVCEELEKMGPRFRHLPIVFLTSVESHAMELLGREYGAYLRKPVEERELLATVEAQLNLVGSHNLQDMNV